jgi:alpha-L-fucosidase
LSSKYAPVDILFIDGKGEQVTKDVAWGLQPDRLIIRGAIAAPEQHVPGVVPQGAREPCLTMGTQWQDKRTSDGYKSGTRLIALLIEARAKGGRGHHRRVTVPPGDQ